MFVLSVVQKTQHSGMAVPYCPLVVVRGTGYSVAVVTVYLVCYGCCPQDCNPSSVMSQHEICPEYSQIHWIAAIWSPDIVPSWDVGIYSHLLVMYLAYLCLGVHSESCKLSVKIHCAKNVDFVLCFHHKAVLADRVG